MARRWLLSSLLGLCCAPTLLASGPTGTVTGTVTDASGAVVRKAKVTVTHEATNAVRNASSNDAGDYTMIGAELARRTGRPVRAALSRREENIAAGNRNATIQKLIA